MYHIGFEINSLIKKRKNPLPVSRVSDPCLQKQCVDTRLCNSYNVLEIKIVMTDEGRNGHSYGGFNGGDVASTQ